ncbi:hypothetical protein [Raoultella terrigena]|uniref:hypothetical protein n=1 Tax=Raoultella terrigena TaxID=577 RepID=UPI00389151CF
MRKKRPLVPAAEGGFRPSLVGPLAFFQAGKNPPNPLCSLLTLSVYSINQGMDVPDRAMLFAQAGQDHAIGPLALTAPAMG